MSETRRPAWSWPEVVAAFLVGVTLPAVAFHLLIKVGFYAALYGPERVAALKPDEPDQTRFLLWAGAIAFPFQIAGVLGLLWHTARATPADIGLGTTDTFTEAVSGIVGRVWRIRIDLPEPGSIQRGGASVGRQLLVALALAVVLVPAVYGVNWLSLEAAKWLDVPQREHGFTKLYKAGLSPAEWGLLIFAAVVVAPVWEELFFRGVLQPVVIAEEAGGQLAALGVAVVVAFLSGPKPAGIAALIASAACPLLPRAWRGVYATAVLFAFVHSAAWPSPIPLLLLAVGLGWLARGGLAGPILLHALFNAVACLLLLFSTLVPGTPAR